MDRIGWNQRGKSLMEFVMEVDVTGIHFLSRGAAPLQLTPTKPKCIIWTFSQVYWYTMWGWWWWWWCGWGNGARADWPSFLFEPSMSSVLLKSPSRSIWLGCLGRKCPSIVGAEGKARMLRYEFHCNVEMSFAGFSRKHATPSSIVWKWHDSGNDRGGDPAAGIPVNEGGD